MVIQHELVLKARDFEIIQCLSKIQHDFGVHSPKILQDIETRILEFYETFLNSQVQPRVLFACLVDYYRKTRQIIIRRATILKVFGVDRTWMLKKQKQYLEQMGLKIPVLPQITLLY